MSATLKLTHKTIGVEVRRGTYDAVVDGKHAGTLELNETIDIPVEPGRHTLQVRNGPKPSSRTRRRCSAAVKTPSAGGGTLRVLMKRAQRRRRGVIRGRLPTRVPINEEFSCAHGVTRPACNRCSCGRCLCRAA